MPDTKAEIVITKTTSWRLEREQVEEILVDHFGLSEGSEVDVDWSDFFAEVTVTRTETSRSNG